MVHSGSIYGPFQFTPFFDGGEDPGTGGPPSSPGPSGEDPGTGGPPSSPGPSGEDPGTGGPPSSSDSNPSASPAPSTDSETPSSSTPFTSGSHGGGGPGGGGPSSTSNALGPVTTTPKVDPQLAKAQTVAQSAQAGAVNSAYGASMASGLSPTQSALLGSKAGASAYQSSLGGAYQTAVNEETGMAQANNQANENNNNFVGGLLSGLAGLILQKGSDNVTALVGENGPEASISRRGEVGQVGTKGPEVRVIQKGTAIVPNVKDGYSMLQYITNKIKNPDSQPTTSAPKIDNSNKEVSNMAMIGALNDKLEKTLNYIKTMGLQNKGIS